MAKINDKPPRAPQFPWDLRVLVRPKQLERPNKVKKKGDPKNPALASQALLESIGPGHNSDELRLPHPTMPPGHDADLMGFSDLPQLAQLAERAEPEIEELTERALASIQTTPDRRERLFAFLGRERQMLKRMREHYADVQEVDQKRREETKDENY
jgi:hypothetical protein